MPKFVQMVRHITADAQEFLGLLGQITVDITKHAVIVHDGSTVGGFTQAREDLSNSPGATISADGKMLATQVQALNTATTKSDANDVKLFSGETIDIVNADYTVPVGKQDQAEYTFTSTPDLSADRTVTFPDKSQRYLILNSTAGGSFKLNFDTPSGTAIELDRDVISDVFVDRTGQAILLGIKTPVAIEDGGTGSTTAMEAKGTSKLNFYDREDITSIVKQAVDLAVPIGTVHECVYSTLDPGFWPCDGSTIGDVGSGADHESADNQALFDILNVAGKWGNDGLAVWGSGDTVKLPDRRGRSGIGEGTSPDAGEGGGAGTNRVLGTKLGEEEHTQAGNEVGQHNHQVNRRTNQPSNTNPGSSDANNHGGTIQYNTENNSAPVAMDWMQPNLVMNYQIKYRYESPVLP